MEQRGRGSCLLPARCESTFLVLKKRRLLVHVSGRRRECCSCNADCGGVGCAGQSTGGVKEGKEKYRVGGREWRRLPLAAAIRLNPGRTSMLFST